MILHELGNFVFEGEEKKVYYNFDMFDTKIMTMVIIDNVMIMKK